MRKNGTEEQTLKPSEHRRRGERYLSDGGEEKTCSLGTGWEKTAEEKKTWAETGEKVE